ncbi:MAG: DUF4214 domain-containing protein [Pseudomonadota bacterium]
MSPSPIRRVALCAAVSLLAACGGGQHSAPASTNAPVLAASVVAEPDYNALVQHLYIAYFGRAADPAGLAYWAAWCRKSLVPTDMPGFARAYGQNAGVTLLMDEFGKSAESRALYTGDNDAFLNAIYHNVLSRDADAGGKAWWLDKIERGVLTRPLAAAYIMAGAQGSDALSIERKAHAVDLLTTFFKTIGFGSGDYVAVDTTVLNERIRALLVAINAGTDTATVEQRVRDLIAELAIIYGWVPH